MLAQSRRLLRVIEVVVIVALLAVGIWIRLEARFDRHWCFAGSDSFGYAKLGHELITHGRYALGPPPEPLAWVRMPLYPMFLAVVLPSGDVYNASWTALFAAQFAFDIMTGLLAWAMARRMAGPIAGVIALGITEINPFTPLFSLAMLTETMSTLLTTAALAAIMFGAARPRRWWPVAGALIALGMLLRPDALMLAIGFVPALLLAAASRREKLTWCAAALLGFVVVFAPWPIRNLAQFGHAYPIGGRIDRFSRPVENYEGYWHWLRSWSRDWEGMTRPTTCFYDPTCNARMLDDLRARGAYADVDDEATVRPLIDDRFKRGITAENSLAFQKLADARRRAHPLLVEVWLPLSRSWFMWVAPFNELLQGRPPWVWLYLNAVPLLMSLSLVQMILWLAAALFLSLYRRTRADASILATVIVVRTLILGYTFYSMPRYSIELMPTAWTLIAVAAVLAARLIRSRVRAQ
jgi:hypothetical protein